MNKLREMVQRIIKEETGKVKAKPVVKKGEKVKVKNLYNNQLQTIIATSDSWFDSGEFWFMSGPDDGSGLYCTFNRKTGQWEIDPEYQDQ